MTSTLVPFTVQDRPAQIGRLPAHWGSIFVRIPCFGEEPRIAEMTHCVRVQLSTGQWETMLAENIEGALRIASDFLNQRIAVRDPHKEGR